MWIEICVPLLLTRRKDLMAHSALHENFLMPTVTEQNIEWMYIHCICWIMKILRQFEGVTGRIPWDVAPEVKIFVQEEFRHALWVSPFFFLFAHYFNLKNFSTPPPTFDSAPPPWIMASPLDNGQSLICIEYVHHPALLSGSNFGSTNLPFTDLFQGLDREALCAIENREPQISHSYPRMQWSAA